MVECPFLKWSDGRGQCFCFLKCHWWYWFLFVNPQNFFLSFPVVGWWSGSSSRAPASQAGQQWPALPGGICVAPIALFGCWARRCDVYWSPCAWDRLKRNAHYQPSVSLCFGDECVFVCSGCDPDFCLVKSFQKYNGNFWYVIYNFNKCSFPF
jgi:hypothetical protein